MNGTAPKRVEAHEMVQGKWYYIQSLHYMNKSDKEVRTGTGKQIGLFNRIKESGMVNFSTIQNIYREDYSEIRSGMGWCEGENCERHVNWFYFYEVHKYDLEQKQREQNLKQKQMCFEEIINSQTFAIAGDHHHLNSVGTDISRMQRILSLLKD